MYVCTVCLNSSDQWACCGMVASGGNLSCSAISTERYHLEIPRIKWSDLYLSLHILAESVLVFEKRYPDAHFGMRFLENVKLV